MSVLEERPTVGRPPAPGAPLPKPELGSRQSEYRGRSRFAVYFTRYGWIHALLLLSVWMFLFPFFWMLGTSMKTDEELLNPSILPEVVHFRPSSPYVRKVLDPQKPSDVETARWEQMLPRLMDVATTAIQKYQAAHPPVPSIAGFNADHHREAAAKLLTATAVRKIDRRLWAGADGPLLDSYRAFLTDSAIADALTNSLADIGLNSFELGTLDLHTFVLAKGKDFASSWRVESGPGKLFADGDSTMLSYHFDSASSEPVVLRYDFRLPDGVKPDDLHKLTLATGSDNSWHRVTATLDVAGTRWASDEASYIAQYRPASFIFQPPSFDDTVMRAKIWVSLKKIGASPEVPATEVAGPGIPATFRLILTPSSTLRANWGKVWRNYDRAFKSVPFWRYMTNSLLLVVLCTVGSLFSASFVAYAFARLHWPGRSVAFLLVLSTMMLPGQVTMIPGFMIWRAVHWYNTLNPLWVPTFFGSAFFIFLMTQHMRTIPKDLEEAARLDGLNALQSWYYVILPNVTPTLAAIAILSFMGAWNDFMGPLIYLRDQTRFPLSLGLYGLGLLRTTPSSDFGWSVVMAGNMLMTVPVIVVFFMFQRYFVEGMTLTGMKG